MSWFLRFPSAPSLAVRKHSLRVPCRHCNIHFRAAIFPVSAHHIVSDLGFFLQKQYASSSPTGDFQVEGSYWELPLLLGLRCQARHQTVRQKNSIVPQRPSPCLSAYIVPYFFIYVKKFFEIFLNFFYIILKRLTKDFMFFTKSS